MSSVQSTFMSVVSALRQTCGGIIGGRRLQVHLWWARTRPNQSTYIQNGDYVCHDEEDEDEEGPEAAALCHGFFADGVLLLFGLLLAGGRGCSMVSCLAVEGATQQSQKALMKWSHSRLWVVL